MKRLLVCLLLGACTQVWSQPREAPAGKNGHGDKTDAYIRQMRVETFEQNGSDCTNPKYSPLRLGKSLDELDTVYDYDFKRLAKVENKLKGVDRRRVLAELFRRICTDCKTDLQRHLAILEFCNKASFHNLIQPMWPDKQCVFDPLICLELAEQRCGQTARLVADLFQAADYPGRLVQLGAHISCEVYYDDDWHYIDAGLFGGRWTVFDDDGSIPSYAELSLRPYAIDAMPSNFEPTYTNDPLGSGIYTSWFYFSRQSYSTPPLYYEKTATPEQEQRSRMYGWNYYTTVRDQTRQLQEFEKKYHPGAPSNLRVEDDQIVWETAADLDDDLLGYRIYIGSKSRGWTYGKAWKPRMYDARFKLPPRDIAMIMTKETACGIPKSRPLYITVMAYDKHGEAHRRTLYPMSHELVVE